MKMAEQPQTIQSKIHTIRGMKVMLDRDLAEMYGVETRRLNEQVKRNGKRFEGEDFMFQLSKEETKEFSKSQNAILKTGRGSNIKYAPYAFTELGVAMLSSVLNSDTAIEINKAIMRVFVEIRQLVAHRPTDRIEELREYVEDMFAGQNDINEDTRLQLELINQTLAEMQADNKERNYPRRRIGYTQ
jgi:hypothetical protein